MNIIFLGAPGSGKGTQAEKVAKKYNLQHISGGAFLRQEAESGSRKGILIAHLMAKGELVPFQTINDVIEPIILANPDSFVLDGTPRDLVQAEYLTEFFAENRISISLVIYLEAPDEKLVGRLLERAKIEHRDDDTEESIQERFNIFHTETEPVISYYESLGLLRRVNGDRTIEEIETDIAGIIESK